MLGCKTYFLSSNRLLGGHYWKVQTTYAEIKQIRSLYWLGVQVGESWTCLEFTQAFPNHAALTSAGFQNKKTYDFIPLAKSQLGESSLVSQGSESSRGITLQRKGEGGGAGFEEMKSSSDAREKKKWKEVIFKAKGSAIFIRNLCTDFSLLRPLRCKRVANELPLAQFGVRWCAGGIRPPPPPPSLSSPSPLHTPLREASHVLIEVEKKCAKVQESPQTQYNATNAASGHYNIDLHRIVVVQSSCVEALRQKWL